MEERHRNVKKGWNLQCLVCCIMGMNNLTYTFFHQILIKRVGFIKSLQKQFFYFILYKLCTYFVKSNQNTNNGPYNNFYGKEVFCTKNYNSSYNILEKTHFFTKVFVGLTFLCFV